MRSAFRGRQHHLTSLVRWNPEVTMSPKVAFPHVSANRGHGVGHALVSLVCMLQAGDAGAWGLAAMALASAALSVEP